MKGPIIEMTYVVDVDYRDKIVNYYKIRYPVLYDPVPPEDNSDPLVLHRMVTRQGSTEWKNGVKSEEETNREYGRKDLEYTRLQNLVKFS